MCYDVRIETDNTISNAFTNKSHLAEGAWIETKSSA